MANNSNPQILNIVSTALGQSNLLGISEMLKSIAKACGAHGCALWQVAPGAQLECQPPKGDLFASAEWYEHGQQTSRYYLPLERSATGMAVTTNQVVNIRNIHKDPRYLRDTFTMESDIGAMCSLPIRFRDGNRGALDIYRKKPFSKSEITQATQFASLLPALVTALRDRASLELIGGISEYLRDAEVRAAAEPLPKQDIKQVIQRICELVAETFQCLETSIFLEDRLEAPHLFQLTATTWPIPIGKPSYRVDDVGLTGWVLKHALPLRIFDLGHFEREADYLHRKYPGLQWKDTLSLDHAVRDFLKVDQTQILRPLSFMAVPILSGDRVQGAIRCCGVKREPFYFAEREVNLLKLVAEQVSRYWSGWLGRYETQQENYSWRTLVKSLGALNSFVHRELNLEQPDERRIFAQALRATSIIPGAEIMDVRQYDENSRELFFAEVHGKAWGEGTEREGRMERRYRVTGSPPASAGAHVCQTGKVYVIPDISKDPYYSEMFPETRRMIIAPIKIEDKRFGVLDICGTGDREFPQEAKFVAELLGQQLGMYKYLADMIGELRRTKADLRTNLKTGELIQEQQIQIFQDLEHQIKTPIMQAHAHVQLALRAPELDEKSRCRLWAIRGLCAKAKRVSQNIQLFSTLARGNPIRLKISTMRADELIKLLIEAAQDNRIINSRGGMLDFYVDDESFERVHYRHPPLRELQVDKDLLAQAITDILDNAAKYSFSRTAVRISGGRTRTGGFSISFQNQGIPIRQWEISSCTQRGWKGEQAQAVSDTGSGIGLWIVDHIMTAHGGSLIIEPTTRDFITTVRFIFPSERVK